MFVFFFFSKFGNSLNFSFVFKISFHTTLLFPFISSSFLSLHRLLICFHFPSRDQDFGEGEFGFTVVFKIRSHKFDDLIK